MRRSALVAAALIALWGTVLTPTTGVAQGSCIDPGTDVPVIFVHGLLGDANAWTDDGGDGHRMFEAVNSLEGFIAHAFDYGDASDQWVDDERIGPALAERIVCLSDAVERNTGVPGKVVLVGHSMGGLAIRYAAAQPAIADRIGLVVTLGTPHLGSSLAEKIPYRESSHPIFGVVARPLERLTWRIVGESCVQQAARICELLFLRYADTDAAPAMVSGSTELANLPGFPSSLPVKTIAGDIRVSIPWFAGDRLALFSIGDFVVGAESASAPATLEELGGGAAVVTCEVSITNFLQSVTPCFHLGLLGNQKVIDAVVSSLQERFSSVRPMLTPDGLGIATFGDDGDQVVSTLVSFLGAPKLDSRQEPGWCDIPSGRIVAWDGLGVVFLSRGIQQSFVGYLFGVGFPLYHPNHGNVFFQLRNRTRLSTVGGITVGDSDDAVRDAHPSAHYTPEDGPYVPYYTVADSRGSLRILMDGGYPHGRVSFIEAGDTLDCF